MYFAFNCTIVPFLLLHLPNIRMLLGVLTPLTLQTHSVVARCPHPIYPTYPIQLLLDRLTPFTLYIPFSCC